MAYNDQNVFAKILRGELPCIKVYEDEHTLAFMDIMPQVAGHTLVIPKVAAETLFDLPADAASHLMHSVQKVAAAVKAGMGVEGVVVMQLNGAAAGQTVPHIHFHLIPGSILDLRNAHAQVMGDQAHIAAHADKIRAAFSIA